jgi:predicted flap endonuclease-1-like 5' DNA nuclease
MFYDIVSFPVWLLAAALIGTVVGWITYTGARRRGWFDGWARWGAIAFAIGLVVAVLKLLPGRAGLWLEIALLMMFVYILGCFLGGWLKNLRLAPEQRRTNEAAAAKARADQAAVIKAESDRLAADAAATVEADRRAAAKQEADRLAAEAAATVEADRQAAAAQAESERLAAEAAATAEADRGAIAAKAEADRSAAEAAAKAEADRQAAAAKAESDRLAAEADSKAEADLQVAVAASPGVMPVALTAPTGAADDLKLIKGIGLRNEIALNALGVYHFSQIADWTPDNATWMGHHMAFPGRIERESWIPQAKLLAAGIDTEHSAGVKSGTIAIDDSADAPMSEADASSFAAGMPAMLAKVEGEANHSGSRPLGLVAPRGGVADDLKRIKGIGKQNEARLHGLGVWHFNQIAAWSAENVKWTGSYLAFRGRIDREKWISQAKDLAAGRDTEFARRVDAGLVKTSRDDGSHGQHNVVKVESKES